MDDWIASNPADLQENNIKGIFQRCEKCLAIADHTVWKENSVD